MTLQEDCSRLKDRVHTTAVLDVGFTHVDEYVAEVGLVSEHKSWVSELYMAEDVFYISEGQTVDDFL